MGVSAVRRVLAKPGNARCGLRYWSFRGICRVKRWKFDVTLPLTMSRAGISQSQPRDIEGRTVEREAVWMAL